jgi:hypothetical protein
MKRHSGWLAAGLLLFAVLACNLSKNSNNNNSNNSNSNSNSNNKNSNTSTTNRPANADVYVEKIHMAKDKDGAPGEDTTTFEQGDRTIHCVINLNKAKGGTNIKFVWKAVDVTGIQSGDLTTVEYTTKSFENLVHSHLTRPSDWPTGTYEADVYINGALDKIIKFTVE